MSRSFIWDAEDRQTSATISGVTYTYLYDGLGQRVQKTGNGATTTFVYDADGNLAAEYQIAGQLAAACPTATCYVTADHLGSTRMITDSSGNVAARYDYLPFGTELQAGTGGRLASMGYTLMPDGFLLKFTGQARDQETGLDYMHARMYSPAEGRFTGVDPGNAGAYMGNGQSWNGYAYVTNNPLSFTDPSGMFESAGDGGWTDLIAGGIIAGFEALGHGLEDLFGGGGSHPDLSNVAWTPVPTWSVTGWDMADTASSSGLGVTGSIYTIPGLLFFAQATDSLPRTEFRTGSNSATTSCVGWATVRGVGGSQATARGALYSLYPQISGGSIRGGTFGTVAVQNGFLGLSTRKLRTFGTQITVTPFSGSIVTRYGGPAGPWTVSDYGDPNIQATQGVAFDLYRFPTVAAGNQFGKWQMHVSIDFPNASGGSCPAGFTVTK